jgi:hypothetical protein
MAKKRGARRDASPAKPKQLRKRLRKAEDQLEDARTKRDRAQARLDALAIIADEIRAQLAELGEAEDGPDATEGPADAAEPSSESTAAEPASEAEAKKKPAKPKALARSRKAGTKPKTAKAPPSGPETAADASSPEAPVSS